MSEEQKAIFIDKSGTSEPAPELWEPAIVKKADFDAEIRRLSGLPRPNNGRRTSWIIHPDSHKLGVGLGLAPGIRPILEVLNPGEQTRPIRHNSTQVNFCIQGSGHSVVGGKRIDFEQYDLFNFPSMQTYIHVNDTDQVQARLTYTNAPLLEKMNVHIVEEDPPADMKVVEEAKEGEVAHDDPRRKSPYGTFQLTDDGAWMMPYEILIAPESVESRALHWPWKKVKAELDKLTALGKDYVGRRLYLLWNPMTGRTNGTTPNFFATITIRPPGIVDKPHRHVSAAMNYIFGGQGNSRVEGKVYEWESGDLLLTAPGWAVHNHASTGDEPVYELTIQDQPLNIVMESLLWQEDMQKPWSVLGADTGFDTNRDNVAKAS
ncbi:MAG: cupin domain-containing protein [Alphaproteobacteria bacterium]|nr:cupin domain-containing protein [Alphaproteobacteria bacterium]